MKSKAVALAARAILLAVATSLSIGAAPALAGDGAPALRGVASKVVTDEIWDDGDEVPPVDAGQPPAPPSEITSPSDVESVPVGPTTLRDGGAQPRRPMAVIAAPNLKQPALDEAYEGFIDDTVSLVLHPDCPHLSRDCGCLPPAWAHRTGVFGEYLFLRPRSTDFSYASPVTTETVAPRDFVNVPSGKVGNLDPNYSSGFRTGFNRAIDQFASIRATYTWYQNSARDTATALPGNELQSSVSYPGIFPAGANFGRIDAASSLKFQFADLELRKILSYGQHHALNYSVGARYVHLSGGMNFQQTGGVGGPDFVTANSNFDGGGLRFGLDGEHYARRTGLLAYWRGGASFIGGQFRENYTDTSYRLSTPLLVDSHWNGGRLVTILDAEIGVGWSSRSQRMRFRAGYLINGWFNTVGPGGYVGAVQARNFDHMVKAFSLDGLTASAEWRF